MVERDLAKVDTRVRFPDFATYYSKIEVAELDKSFENTAISLFFICNYDIIARRLIGI